MKAEVKDVIEKADAMQKAMEKLTTGLAKDGVALDGFVDAHRAMTEYWNARVALAFVEHIEHKKP